MPCTSFICATLLGKALGRIIEQQPFLYFHLQTDLAHQNPFTIPLKNLGNNLTTEREKGTIFIFIGNMKLFYLDYNLF